MKVFVSSVILGFEAEREAAARGACTLDHEVKRAEDFNATSASPQATCLAGVRWADAVVLLLGRRYGDVQSSGLSATHEEYREARNRCDVLAFIQTGIEREAKQDAFVKEVQDYTQGIFTRGFA